MAWLGRNWVNGQPLTNVGAALATAPANGGPGNGVGIAETYSGTGGSGYSETAAVSAANGLSVHVIVNPANLTATNTFAGFGSAGNADRYAVLDLSGTEANDPIRVIQNGGTFGGTYYNSPPANQWNSYTAVWNSGTNNLLYRDGVLLTPSAANGSAAANFPPINRIDHGQSSQVGPINILNGRLLLTMHWVRRLSALEARMLAANPWQVLKAPRRIWVPQSASTGLPTITALTPTSITSTTALQRFSRAA